MSVWPWWHCPYSANAYNWRNWAWRQRMNIWGYRDPFHRHEYSSLYRYQRRLDNAWRRLRYPRSTDELRYGLSQLLDAHLDYARRRRSLLFPSPRWRRHWREYSELLRYQREMERLSRRLRYDRNLTERDLHDLFRRSLRAQRRYIESRMADIKRNNRLWWRDKEYRELERRLHELRREESQLRRRW